MTEEKEPKKPQPEPQPEKLPHKEWETKSAPEISPNTPWPRPDDKTEE
jgi:hypothetical protein